METYDSCEVLTLGVVDCQSEEIDIGGHFHDCCARLCHLDFIDSLPWLPSAICSKKQIVCLGLSVCPNSIFSAKVDASRQERKKTRRAVVFFATILKLITNLTKSLHGENSNKRIKSSSYIHDSCKTKLQNWKGVEKEHKSLVLITKVAWICKLIGDAKVGGF